MKKNSEKLIYSVVSQNKKIKSTHNLLDISFVELAPSDLGFTSNGPFIRVQHINGISVSIEHI